MDTLWQDLRFNLRLLLKRPAFTFIVTLALALGIGANTAIFSVMNAVLLNQLPYKDAEQLVWLSENSPPNDVKDEPLSLPNYIDWRDQNSSFQGVGAMARTIFVLTEAGEPERLHGAIVTANLFPVLGVEPALGRNFTDEENSEGKNRVVIMSHNLWQRRFGARADIVGQQLMLNGFPYTVVGVMPKGFKNANARDSKQPELWSPLVMKLDPNVRRADFLSVVARLKPGVTIEQARAEMTAITARLAQQYPATNEGWTAAVTSLHERIIGDVRPAILLLMGIVGFLLLIACANVANLMLARAASRHQEIAIRAAMGAGRARLVRQFLVESVLLAIPGGALGLLMAYWGIDLLVALSPGNIPRIDEIGLNGTVLLFTVAISLLTGIIFGLIPALQASSPNLVDALKESSRSATEGVRSGRVRNALVIAEVALSLVMLIGAGLMIKSFMRLQNVDPGFKAQQLLVMDTLLPRAKYKEGPQVSAFYEQFLEKAAALPGVESVAAINSLPLSGGGAILAFQIEGRPPRAADNIDDAEHYVVTSAYFKTMGIPLIAGNLFTARDNKDMPLVTVINQSMARKYWPNQDPIGKRINLGDPKTDPWITVVGIVGDIKHKGLSEANYPQMYVPHAQNQSRVMTLVARTSSDPLDMVTPIKNALLSMDKDQAPANIRTMAEVVSASIARPRFNMLLITAFAFIGMVLAIVGIYGVISYSVTQRTHEIGIRMALGARPYDIMRLILKQGLRLSGVGVGLGLAAALALTRLMSSLLYSVSAIDPVTFLLLSAVLISIALIACYIPARRAMRVDPMHALRYD